MKITYREPHGERELEAIFNLRYQVYVEELGRPITHTNHQTKQIKDNVDAFATHYVAVVDGQIIGAMRTHKLADGEFPGVELYQPHLFEAYYPDQICFCSYLVIAKEYRNSMAAIKLTCKSYEYMRRENMQVNLMNCSPNLLRIYQYLGHRFYLGENFFYDSFQFSVTPMALIMEDIDFLKSLRSPLYKIAAKFTNSPSCARFFNAKFGHQNQELPPFCQSKFALRRKHFKACHFTPELRTLIKEHSRQELTFLSEQIDRIQMYKGDILYRQGDVSNAIYLLIEHQQQTQNGPITDRPSQLIGLEYLAGQKRQTSYVIKESADLYILTDKVLEKISRHYPKLMQTIYKLALGHLLTSNQELESTHA